MLVLLLVKLFQLKTSYSKNPFLIPLEKKKGFLKSDIPIGLLLFPFSSLPRGVEMVENVKHLTEISQLSCFNMNV